MPSWTGTAPARNRSRRCAEPLDSRASASNAVAADYSRSPGIERVGLRSSSSFAKHDGNLGGSGAVAWLFERRGMVLVDADRFDEDEVMLAAAEGGADDVERDGSSFRVTSAPESLTAVREAIEAAGIEVDSSELTMVPKTTVNLDDEGAAKKTLRLIDALEENDDVQEVYANFDIPEQVMEAVAT